MKTHADILHSLHSVHVHVQPCNEPGCRKPHAAIAKYKAHIAALNRVAPEDEEHAAFLRFHRAHAAKKLQQFEQGSPAPRDPIAHQVLDAMGTVVGIYEGPYLAMEHAQKIGGRVIPIFD
jgi:hypothetical protein